MNMCDIFELKHLINTPNCFTSDNKPLLVDVILTNSENVTKISGTCNFRELTRKVGIELNKSRHGYSIREKFPPELEERWKPLYPVMRRYNSTTKVNTKRNDELNASKKC